MMPMYPKERLERIMQILQQQGFATVRYLTAQLHYSTATINRDLNILQKQQLVHRSYGGVELSAQHATPPNLRYQVMRVAKNRIARAAAAFVRDGDTVFIDGTTTTQHMAGYLLERKNIRVITNNMSLAAFLSERGVNTVCLGGQVVEPPSMLDGAETAQNAASYVADKCFFATGGVTSDGKILVGTHYIAVLQAMMRNAREVYHLADHDKVDFPCPRVLTDFDAVQYVISDYLFPQETQDRFAATHFITVPYDDHLSKNTEE